MASRPSATGSPEPTPGVFGFVLGMLEAGRGGRFFKWIWRRVYNRIGRKLPDAEWRFLNYGYLPDRAESFHLEPEDEAHRPFIGLYHQAVEGLSLKGTRVLEVGSGRGGGASYLARYHEPAEVVGVDQSTVGNRVARRINPPSPGFAIRDGDAEDLPFPDDSFDVVVNIESSHCYADLPRFAAEVHRVLRPGGVFSWADMRSPAMLPALDRAFASVPLTLVEERDLSPGVVRALDATDVVRRRTIEARGGAPAAILREFAGTRGSILYRGLQNGDVVYLSRRYQKPD